MKIRRVISVVIWFTTLLIGALLTWVGISVFPREPQLSALSFILALPTALLAVKSTRWSTLGFLLLLLWDVALGWQPGAGLNGNVKDFFQSQVDVMVLAEVLLSVALDLVSPTAGIRSVSQP